MRAVIYVRVSTEEQAREGVSLEVQETRLKAYCVSKDWTLVGVERDEGLSAKNLRRPGMERVVGLVVAGQVDAVLVFKLDRLTRSIVDLANLLQMFDRRGVALVSLQESLDPTTSTGRLMMNLLISVSQWEREVISERTKAAMRHLRVTRDRPYCFALYGYRREGQMLLVAPEEQEVIGAILEMRARKLSYMAIAEALNGIGTPAKAGGRWYASTVRKIIVRCEEIGREAAG